MTRPVWRRLINRQLAGWTIGVAVVTLAGYTAAIGLRGVLDLVLGPEPTSSDQVPLVAAASFAIAAELIGVLLSWAVWYPRGASTSSTTRDAR